MKHKKRKRVEKNTLDLKKVIELINKKICYSEEDNLYYIFFGVDEPPLHFFYKRTSSSKEDLLVVISLEICEMYEKHYKSAQILWSVMNG